MGCTEGNIIQKESSFYITLLERNLTRTISGQNNSKIAYELFMNLIEGMVYINGQGYSYLI